MAKKMTWIAHARYAEDAAVNLLCFPYAGGSAAYFSPLKAEIDSRINLCPVLYPGRERNAGIPNFDTLEACAKAFVTENPQLFQKPVAFFGHCTGSLVAYEAAIAAQKQYGVNPVLFFASSAPAPSCENFFPDMQLTPEDMTRYLLDNGMIDASFAENPMFRSYFLPLMHQDLAMHLQYRPRVPYEKMHTKVHVLYGNQDPMFQDASLIAQWGAFSEGVDATEFSGGHFYLNQCQKPAGQLVTEHLLQELAGLSI